QDTTFTISDLPQYTSSPFLESPRTLHSLYLVSHSTQHRNANILVNINC
ncbi:unnamed protein product, partial [Staurois parvus]